MRTMCWTAVLFWACGEPTTPRLEVEPDERAEAFGPDVTADVTPDGLAVPVAPALPADDHCPAPRRAQVDVLGRGAADGSSVLEHLDASGCPAVRVVTRVDGGTTTTVTEVPGDPRWFPQPPAYVDLTPRPQTETTTLDAAGRLVEYTQDLGSDGTIEHRERQRWDGERLLERTVEADHDRHTRWTYDANGDVARVEDESDGVLRVTEHERDARGRTTLERASVDGEVRSLRTYRFAGERPLEARLETPDMLEVTRWTYRPDGTLSQRQWSRSAAQTVAIVEHHGYEPGAAGQVVEHYRLDQGGDGTIEAQRWTTRDAEGREVLVVHDNDADGREDWRRAQRWDERGRMVWWRNQERGRTTLLRAWTFAGDTWLESRQFPHPAGPGTRLERRRMEGEVEVIEARVEETGEVLAITRTRHHTPEIIAEQTVDRGGDGTIDLRFEQVVDDAGRVVRSERAADGVTVWRSMAYDHTGQVAEERGTQVPGGPEVLLRQLVRDRAGRLVYQLRARGDVVFRAVVDYD